MRGGVWVLNIFAALWGVATVLVAHFPTWLAVLPVATSAALLLWAQRQPVGTGSPIEGRHAGRVVAIATAAEGVALFVAGNLLVNLHWPTAVMPVAVIIVGLHFLPLARWIPVPLYYRTGGGMIAVGAVALLLSPADRAIASGVGAALVLWVSGVLLVRWGRG